MIIAQFQVKEKMNFQMKKKEKDKDYKEIEKLLKNVEKKRKKNN